MALPDRSQETVRFGDFEIDLHTAELRTNGHRFILQGQPFEVLALLLEQPGQLVTREELKRRLWTSDTFVDFDRSLNKAVNRLRETLADSAENPRFIETLPRRGYRFIAPIRIERSKEPTTVPTSSAVSTGHVYRWPASSGTAIPLDAPTAPSPGTAKAVLNGKFLAAFIFAAVFLLLAVGLGVRVWLPRTRTLSFDTLEITKLTDSGSVKNVAISHDGRYVAYALLVGEKQELRLRQVATRSDVQILPPDLGNFVGLTFSPDANYLYFVRSDRSDLSFRYLYSVASLGGTPRKLIADVDSAVAFSPNGREITYEHWVRNDMELKIANADGTGDRLLVVVHNANFLSPGDPGPNWSPNGRTIVFSKLLVGKPRRWVLYAVSVADGTPRELYVSADAIGRPVWVPTGDTLLLPHYEAGSHRSQLWTVSFPEGVARRFTHDISDYSADLDIAERWRGP